MGNKTTDEKTGVVHVDSVGWLGVETPTLAEITEQIEIAKGRAQARFNERMARTSNDIAPFTGEH